MGDTGQDRDYFILLYYVTRLCDKSIKQRLTRLISNYTIVVLQLLTN